MKKVLHLVAIAFLFALSAQAQSILTADITEMNHGGWGSVLNIGADAGDTITLDVTCDHSDPNGHGTCLYAVPIVQTCSNFGSPTLPPDHLMLNPGQPPSTCGAPSAFQLVFNAWRHQTYQTTSPSTGDQFVETQYWWVGVDVHYYLHVTNLETLNW